MRLRSMLAVALATVLLAPAAAVAAPKNRRLTADVHAARIER